MPRVTTTWQDLNWNTVQFFISNQRFSIFRIYFFSKTNLINILSERMFENKFKVQKVSQGCQTNNLQKWFLPTVRKKCSSDRKKLLKFEAEGREFAKILRSLTLQGVSH